MTRPRSATRQYDVLDAIRAFKSIKGFSPSMRNIMDITGISTLSLVYYYLNRLEEEDLIRRTANTSRSIELVGMSNVESIRAGYKTKVLALKERKKKKVKKTLSQKRIEAGRQGRGVGAFIAKSKKKDEGLEARIDLVVAKAKKKEAAGEPVQAEDVTLTRRKPWSRRLRVHSIRIG